MVDLSLLRESLEVVAPEAVCCRYRGAGLIGRIDPKACRAGIVVIRDDDPVGRIESKIATPRRFAISIGDARVTAQSQAKVSASSGASNPCPGTEKSTCVFKVGEICA